MWDIAFGIFFGFLFISITYIVVTVILVIREYC